VPPMEYARQNGAAGVLMLPDSRTLGAWEGARESTLRRQPGFQVARSEPGTPGVPAVILGRGAFFALLAGERLTGDAALAAMRDREAGPSFEFSPEKRVSFTLEAKTEQARTQNVVGVVEGSDPSLRGEFVALGAHYDHIGVRSGEGDTINNGADDDGSGTVALMAMAEAFARGPRPRRSILFVWHCGEEKGLVGSRYFTDSPTVPLDRIVAQLNIDMIGRSKRDGDMNERNRELSGPDEVYVIGSRMMSTALGDLSDRVNRGYLNLKFNTRYDDPQDPNRFFFRSDHYHYARKGIPIIFYFSGVHEDYHRPSDSAEKIDYRKLQNVTRTVYATAWELASAPRRPAVDKELPAELRGR
jgi:Zn-dependent M28 family amino/carboxypeptidase